MEWTVITHEEKQYIEIITRGDADKTSSLNMAKEISNLSGKLMMKKILIDHSKIDSISGEIIEVYQRPREFKEIGVIQSIKIAEIIKQEHREFFKFLETVCRNNGFQFSIFDDRKSALQWLLDS